MGSGKTSKKRWFNKVSPMPPQFSLQHGWYIFGFCQNRTTNPLSPQSVQCRYVSEPDASFAINRPWIMTGVVVGGGVFFSSLPTSLRQAGPAGVFVGYFLASTIVYTATISSAEMMAHMPNVGGTIGLADVFADPALGFAMGWGSFVASLQTITVVHFLQPYLSTSAPPKASVLYWVVAALFANIDRRRLQLLKCKIFGRIHVVFAILKLGTLVVLTLAALVVDLTPVPSCNTFPPPELCASFNKTLSASMPLPQTLGDRNGLGRVRIGSWYWKYPGPFGRPFGIDGTIGGFVGVLQAVNQAIYSFGGLEATSVLGREVKNPTKSIPRAARRVWLRITILYLAAVLAAGLVVPSNHPNLKDGPKITGSPWAIVFSTATTCPIPRYILITLFTLSLLGTGSVTRFFCSRYLFFLARRGHAPWVLGSLYMSETKGVALPLNDDRRQQGTPERQSTDPSTELIPRHTLPHPLIKRDMRSRGHGFDDGDAAGSRALHNGSDARRRRLWQPFGRPPSLLPESALSEVTTITEPARGASDSPRPQSSTLATISSASQHFAAHSAASAASRVLAEYSPVPGQNSSLGNVDFVLQTLDGTQPKRPQEPLPQAPSSSEHATPRQTKAYPQSEYAVPWVSILCGAVLGTVIMLGPGSMQASRFFSGLSRSAVLIQWIGILITYLRFYYGTEHWRARDPKFYATHKESIYDNRAWGQPWVAVYGLVWCIGILLVQGWSVFTAPGAMRIAELQGDPPVVPNPEIGDFATAFCFSYLPVALLLVLYFGYKLVYQTSFVAVEDMKFSRGDVHSVVESAPSTLWEKILAWVF
ncbi:amino acid permease-domain-containing protein [Auriculariales sp. MPI-PUGE-AT-0066]|nr:amino acid permease-domain-containing protein [Auriculariales sp. MPI-PUGE-AT-0066]